MRRRLAIVNDDGDCTIGDDDDDFDFELDTDKAARVTVTIAASYGLGRVSKSPSTLNPTLLMQLL
jgi:hypothetical protein